MNFSFTDDSVVKIAKPFRLQWETAQDCYVLLYPEGMVKLNESAGMILDRCCNGGKAMSQVIADLAMEFGSTPEEIAPDIKEFLKVAYDNRWIH